MTKPWMVGVAFVAGVLVASGVWTAFPPKEPATSTKPDTAPSESPAVDEGACETANQKLTSQLHECDRRLALANSNARDPHAGASQPDPVSETAGPASKSSESAATQNPTSDGGGPRPLEEPTKEDWERMAKNGVVRARVPCIRDRPWTPNNFVINRLGLAPQDVDALTQAYAASTKRLSAQIAPLCAQVLGNREMVDKMGVAACIEVIQNSARKNPAEAKAALTRVAETNAGKREPAKGGPPIEQLARTLSSEWKTFEKDLATKVGPEDAKRLVQAPELCNDPITLRGVDPGDRAPAAVDAGRR